MIYLVAFICFVHAFSCVFMHGSTFFRLASLSGCRVILCIIYSRGNSNSGREIVYCLVLGATSSRC